MAISRVYRFHPFGPPDEETSMVIDDLRVLDQDSRQPIQITVTDQNQHDSDGEPIEIHFSVGPDELAELRDVLTEIIDTEIPDPPVPPGPRPVD